MSESSPDHKQLPPHPHHEQHDNNAPQTPITAASPVPTSSLVSASAVLQQGDARQVCNGCQLELESETDQVVVSFGTSLWHVDCCCAKCGSLVEHDTNLLLLSDGSPVCENCSYICSVCSKPISNEAIVTGEESYHADCFRCRSCSNKIEELIFAKTSQGIWCMACHNERVAKSRKKSEASKRRKEKERSGESARPSRSRSERERSVSGNPPHNENEQIPTIDANGRPLPPSPTPLPQSESMSTIYGDAHSSLSTPGSTPTRRTRDQQGGAYVPGSSALDPSSSNQSLSGIARNGSPLGLPHNHSRSYSGESGMRPNLGDRRPSGDGRESPLPSPRPHGRNKEYDWGSTGSPREGHPSPTLHAPEGSSRQGSLSAPASDKGQRRRSGFYGAMGSSRPSFDDGIPINVTDDTYDSESAHESPAPPSTSRVVVPPSFLPELHNSVSFYDPDTLLFLDHVGSAPSSPKRKAAGGYPVDITGLPEDQIERLDQNSGSDYGDDDDAGKPRPPKPDVARKVRESIQVSRNSQAGSEAGGAGLDVELVEMLLQELDGTKKEMREIQDKYHAFKRASKSAFEGFSMARDEYDKEVAARRETEARMDKLRQKFVEQAQRLATVDKEQKQAEILKRQSKELKSTVSGMEKHLSQLKAEVELSVAQVAELAAVESQASSPSDTSRPVSGNASQSDVVQALNARLEAVKDSHRRDIEALIADRDDLAKEVAELRQTREAYTDECNALTQRNANLVSETAEASRQLDMLRDSFARLRAAGAATGAGSALNGSSSTLASSKGAQHSSSNSLSTGLPPVTSRSPLASGRGPTHSPTPAPYDRDLDHLHRFTKPEAAEPQIATVKKFKWGKSSKATAESSSSSKPQPPGSASKPNAVVPRSGSIDNGVRPHYFQPTSILRPVRCEHCGDKMWGLNEVRCSGCGCYSHTKCASSLSAPCAPGNVTEDLSGPLPAGPLMFGNDLTAQLQSEDRQVPVVVTKCIGAVEAYGMTYEGIYRKTGGMGQTKLITQCFERGQDFNLEDLDKFNDLAAITSCMKNFFRSLPDPLFTHALHEEFVSCAELPEGEPRLQALENTLVKLPIQHYLTAKFLVAHLHRVHLQSAENKMTPANLGVVFGPTILRSSQPSREFSDMGPKAKLVELLVEHQPRLFARQHPAEQ